MAPDLEAHANGVGELEPREELIYLSRALHAHVDFLLMGGAFGVPKAEARSPAASLTEPPPSLAPEPPVAEVLPGGPPVQSLPVAAQLPSQRLPQHQPPLQQAPPPNVAERAVPSLAAPSIQAQARVIPAGLGRDERLQLLNELASQIVGCTKCHLCEKRTQTVFARGTGSSGLCFVGEGPGADEDAQGFPFVGAAGQLLDKMIAAMGLSRDEVYVCNIVKCRPPDNRKPLPEEMSACRPYLEAQLETLAPEVIVALGATAVEGLLGTTSGGITRLRGTWKLYKGKIAVMPTFHPAYLLRAPSAKHAVWDDMQAVLRHMGRPVPVRGKKQG